jgi:predicted alpha-1,2-mannosidase
MSMIKHNESLKLLIFLLLFGCKSQFLFAQNQYFTYVDPFIGSEGQGNVFVGPSCPFGMVKPGPDCNRDSNSGYSPDMDQPLYGFSQLHVSGTGGGPKYGNISIMPFGGDFENIMQSSLREQEMASAGYYSVLLNKWKIKAELTTSPKVAFYRFAFKDHTKKGIKIDAGEFLGENHVPDTEAQQFVGSEIEVVSATELRGYSRIRGGWNNGGPYTVYFHIVVNHPFHDFTTWKGSKLSRGAKLQVDSGEKTGALLYFSDQVSDTLQVKIGISFISSSKAKENISVEVPAWNFNKVLEQCRQRWENLLQRVEPDASAPFDQKKLFYTALYHTMLMPVDRTGENPLWTNDQPYYDDFYCIWDTFRTSQPLITLISPSRQASVINAMLNIYQHEGYLPEGRSGNYNGRTQGGSNAEVVLADAFAKGLKGINYDLAFNAMLKNATVPPGGNEEQEGRGGLSDYNNKGYVSTDYVRSGNRTVEYAYNDYCIARVAKGLGYMNEYFRFSKQSDSWQNLWRNYEDHGARGFIMPKDNSGNWVDSIKCDGSNGKANYIRYTPLAQDWPICLCWWCGAFYEASSWEYSLYMPHDVATLIRKSGGRERFQARLDTLFKNKYYNVGNEPSFLSPSLYHWIGRPDLSADRIREIIDKNYNTSRSGIPGNDDSGAMSSWLAFHMIGLYPNAGQSYYLITAPYFKQTVIHQENGKDFKVVTKNLSSKNKYIRSCLLNGKPFNQSWIEHQNIVNGGELFLEMSDKPGLWGTQVLPPSKQAN